MVSEGKRRGKWGEGGEERGEEEERRKYRNIGLAGHRVRLGSHSHILGQSNLRGKSQSVPQEYK